MVSQTRVYSYHYKTASKVSRSASSNLHRADLLVVSKVQGDATVGVYRAALIVASKVTPGIPENLRQTFATTTSVTVEWSASPSGLTPTGYEYKVGESGDILPATSPLLIDGFASPYDSYTIYVRAVSGSVRSGWAILEVSPSVSASINANRSRRTSTISFDNKVLRFYIGTIRQRRVSDITFERDINFRLKGSRRRRVSSISFQRPTITFSFNRDRRRRISSFALEVEVASFSAFVIRRRRVSSLELKRPAASIAYSSVRRRRTSAFSVIFPDQLVYANVTRRARKSNLDVDVFYPIVSIYDGETPIQVLHSDDVWREIGIRP